MGLFRRKWGAPSPLPLTWERTPRQVYTDTNGRHHRTDAPYLLPKDEKELQRLDYQHFILRQVLEGNAFAPVSDLLRRGAMCLTLAVVRDGGAMSKCMSPVDKCKGMDYEGARTTRTALRTARTIR
jgi:hypothetical protein